MTQGREKLQLTNDEARDIVYEDTNDYVTIKNTITSTSRWSAHHRVVVKRLSDGKFFADEYSQGLTEGQDERAYEYSDPDFTEVFPVEKTITVYE